MNSSRPRSPHSGVLSEELTSPSRLDASPSHRQSPIEPDVIRGQSTDARRNMSEGLTPHPDASSSHQSQPPDVMRPHPDPLSYQRSNVAETSGIDLEQYASVRRRPAPSSHQPLDVIKNDLDADKRDFDKRDRRHSVVGIPDVDLRSLPQGDRHKFLASLEAGLGNMDNRLQPYVERVMKELNIPEEHRNEAERHLKGIYDILKKSENATSAEDYDEACRKVSELAPDLTILRWMRAGEIGKVSGALFFGGKKTRLETNNIRMRGELNIAKKAEEATDQRYFAPLSKVADRVTHEMAWRLNEPIHRASLATVLGVASTLTPLAYGGKFEPMAIPINIAATYADTAIFKQFNYPWNLLITTGLWQGSSYATAYSQMGVDKLVQYVRGH